MGLNIADCFTIEKAGQMRSVYFITHSNVVIDPSVAVPKWPLSRRGTERMEALLAQPWVEGIGAIYCSTEQKAIDGAEILARHLSIGHQVSEELGEIDRSSTGYLPRDEFQATMDAFFANPERSIRGWETARQAQECILRAVEEVMEYDQSDGDIAIVSHGAVGALYLCHLKNRPISGDESQPGSDGGNFYCFDVQSRALQHGWVPID